MKFPEQYRIKNPHPAYRSNTGDPFGFFMCNYSSNRALKIMAADGQETGWEHVSVSLATQPDKCPSWPEMCFVKELFWDDDECVIQYHPPKEENISYHDGCLHLWRPVNMAIPMPDPAMVGPKSK